MLTDRLPTCARCGTELPKPTRGRPKKYCSQACRQRAYEQRHGTGVAAGTKGIDERAVVLTPDKVDKFRDQLYELRCAAEDIQTAAREDASTEELADLCAELVSLAKDIERIR